MTVEWSLLGVVLLGVAATGMGCLIWLDRRRTQRARGRR